MRKNNWNTKFQTTILKDSFVNFLKYVNIHIYVSGIFAKKENSDNFPDTAVLAPKQRNNTIW